MRFPSPKIIAAALVTFAMPSSGGSESTFYYSRLRTSAGVPLRWKTSPVQYVINNLGSDNIADGSEDAAIRLAFKTWEDVPGATIAFKENTSAIQKARTDWDATNIRLVLFDENDSSGFFPGGSGVIAITPVSFFTAPPASAGIIGDADIIFNGKNFTFSTDLSPNTIDVQSVCAHEIGHFIGFDHEGFGGATMYPFSAAQQFNQRTVSADDAAGAREAYPGGAKAKITGTIRRSSDNSLVKGAHVWARDTSDGHDVSAAYTDDAGAFTITGLEPGNYRVGVEALNSPVTAANFGAGTLATIETNFQSGQSGVLAVSGTATTAAGDIFVGASPLFNITSPQRVTTLRPGEQKLIQFTGTLPVVGNTEVTMPDTGSMFVLNYAAGNNLTITAGLGAMPGLYDIQLRDTVSDQKILFPGFIEVLPHSPTISSASPVGGAVAGGTTVTIQGTNLEHTAAVVFGDVLVSSIVIVSPTQITVKTAPRATGLVDVIIENTGGAETRLPNGYFYGDLVAPAPAGVFPASGSTSGGSNVVLSGTNFIPGATVKFGNTPAASVLFIDSSQLAVVTPPLAAGVYDVVVENPGPVTLPSTLAGAFTVVAAAGPVATLVAPAGISNLGGETVTVSGSNFVNGATVRLFANITDGSGGTEAAILSITSNQIQFVAPAGPVGAASMIITNPNGLAFVSATALESQLTAISSGKLTGTISTSVDTDVVFYEAVAGARVNATLKGLGVGFTPKIVLKSAAGTTLLSTDPNDVAFNASFASSSAKTAGIKNFIINTAGRVQFVISGVGGSTGKYSLSVKGTLPPDAKAVKASNVAAGPGSANLIFQAQAGATLKGKLTCKNGLQADVDAFTGPGGSILGDPAVLSAIVVAADGLSITFNSVPLKASGAYTLTIGPAGGTMGILNGTLTIVPPKVTSAAVEK